MAQTEQVAQATPAQLNGLSGKVAIVTGGATIIGAAVAKALHQAGVSVVIADIDEKNGQAQADALGENALFIACDIAVDEQINTCVETTVNTFGGVDFLINLACSYLDDGIDSSRADWMTSFGINVVGGVMMMKACRPHMVSRGGGAIVNFGSISAKVAQTGRWLYPVSKAAILQLSRNMAMDLAADKIRVNSVSPGWTWSRIMDELTEGNREKTDAVAADYHLVGRVGDCSVYTQGVLFLCSANASFITGTDLAIDGGYSAMGPEQAVPAIPRLVE